ncbi:hypothetical protein IGI04_035590, partial [Brassica rapa subsp. trilocularis]
MAQDDAAFGAPGEEPTPTPAAAPPITSDFMSSVMARLARQDEVQKTTNDQLAALVAALTAPEGQTSRPQLTRRRLFNTNPTAAGVDHISDDSEPNEAFLADAPPAGSDRTTIRELAELKLSLQQMGEKIHHNPTKSLQDAIARSDNFIRMEEDTNAILSKMSAPKAPAAKNANARQEPRQHAPNDKNGRKDGYMYVVNENNAPISTLVVRGEGWNKWVRELESSDQKVDSVCTTQPAAGVGSAAGPSRTVDLTKHCKYHDVKGHDTSECKSLYAHYLSSLASGEFKFEPLKAKPKNGKSWSKNKERRAQRKATGRGRQNDAPQRDDEEETPRDNGGGDSSADEEHPANRRRIEVILSQQSLSSDEDNDDSPVPGDLRDSLKRRLAPENGSDTTRRDLRTMLDARKSRRISTSDGNNNEGPIGDLRDKLNAGVSDLRVKLNKSKSTDLRRQLERAKGQPQLPPPDTS